MNIIPPFLFKEVILMYIENFKKKKHDAQDDRIFAGLCIRSH